jgi:hypothetical protein
MNTGPLRAIANGLAGDLTTWEEWDGSAWIAATSIPLNVSQRVFTNGFTVTVDVDIFGSIFQNHNNSAPSSVNNGGRFIIEGGIVMTGDVTNFGFGLEVVITTHRVTATLSVMFEDPR